jgi:hypothetical protein
LEARIFHHSVFVMWCTVYPTMVAEPNPMPARKSIYSLTFPVGGGGLFVVPRRGWDHARNSDRCSHACHVARPPCRQSSATGRCRPAAPQPQPRGVPRRRLRPLAQPTHGCLSPDKGSRPKRHILVFRVPVCGPVCDTPGGFKYFKPPRARRCCIEETQNSRVCACCRRGSEQAPLAPRGRAA